MSHAYWRTITALIAIQIGYGILVSLQPRYFQQLVSLGARDIKTALMSEGLRLIGILATIYIGGAILQGIAGYKGCLFSSDLLKRLQIEFFDKISQLPIQYFQRQSAGEFFTKFNNDIGQAQSFVADFLPSSVREMITATIVTGILFYFCPAALTLSAVLVALITSSLVLILNRIMVRYAKAQRKGWSEINRVFDETVQGIDTVKTFAAEKRQLDHFTKHTSLFRDLSVRASSIVAIFSPGVDLLSKFGGLAVLFFAYFMIVRDRIDFDSFLLFFFYAALLQVSVSNLVGSLSKLPNELVGLRNLSSFFTEFSEQSEPKKERASIDRAVPIGIHGLTFSYPGGRTLFLDANMHIPEKAVTILHGKSGSGKSTLINLLLRFYDPLAGSIKLDDVDLSQFSRAELRRKISVVTQFHFIFHDSLKSNLLIAKPDASDEEIIRALKRAHLGEFLSRLPQGINEIMDPRGKGISAGEKQRICIARLLIKNSPVMVLDEPWSNLDSEARNLLAEVINECRASTTILILTHEELPSLSVDLVYSLEHEKGTFINYQ